MYLYKLFVLACALTAHEAVTFVTEQAKVLKVIISGIIIDVVDFKLQKGRLRSAMAATLAISKH
jgi:hypothetical protein